MAPSWPWGGIHYGGCILDGGFFHCFVHVEIFFICSCFLGCMKIHVQGSTFPTFMGECRWIFLRWSIWV